MRIASSSRKGFGAVQQKGSTNEPDAVDEYVEMFVPGLEDEDASKDEAGKIQMVRGGDALVHLFL